MVDTLQICTYNVNGMNDVIKRRKIFTALKYANVDVALLQETHATDKTVQLWQSEWGGRIYASNGDTNVKGVMILCKRNLQYEVVRVETDQEGRIIVMELIFMKVVLLLVNVYAPNQDNPQFFTKVYDIISAFDNCNIIWGGDFNLVFNPQKDRYQSGHNNPKALSILKLIMDELELVDVWRVRNPSLTRYTWARAKSKSRIDYFLVNDGLSSQISDINISASPISDHDPVNLTLKIPQQQRGPGLWKLNTSHLKSKLFVQNLIEITEKCVNDTVAAPRQIDGRC